MTDPGSRREFPAATKVALPLLLLLSGFCGISYEILYTKLLGNLLGNQFTINATVLLTFLLGIGLGTLYAHRFARYLWLIEALIGLYAAAMAMAAGAIDHFLYTSIPFLGTNLFAAALASFVLLLVPAFMIGCSIPLFAAYLALLRRTQVFSLTYGIYNVGAALTAMAMEFLLLRSVGLRAATLILASLNLVVAVGLLLLVRRTAMIPERPVERIRFSARVLAALALASVASAVFQLMMIKIAEFIFGPYSETFSLVLATVLLGIAGGSFVAGRFRLTFSGALLLSLGGLAWFVTVLPATVTLYATFYPSAAEIYPLLVLLKFGLVVALMGLPAVGFGATIPTLLTTHKDVSRESGQLLFCSSVANAFGFLLMAFVLHQLLYYGELILVIAAATAIAVWLHPARRIVSAVTATGLVLVAAIGFTVAWDENLLYVGHKSFRSTKDLEDLRRGQLLTHRFKGPQDVFAIIYKDFKPYFFINGYISIPLSSSSEKLVGAMSTMLAPRLDQALVLGMGSGATAGTVALFYDQTDVVEINRVVLQNLHVMARYNFDIESRPNVDIIHDDGIHHVKTTPKRYSLILNTVTTPQYFSSSKLYTRDFFELVLEKMTPDGIYITWVDGRIGDRGFDIILETLRTSFEECWQTYLKANYYIMACSQQPIQIRQLDSVVANEELRTYLATEHSMPLELIPYSVISTDAFSLQSDWEAPVNTLDYPVLEFEMAQLPPDNLNLEGFKSRLSRKLDLSSVRERVGESFDWTPEEFLFFADLRTKPESTLSNVFHRQLARQFDIDDARYDQIALASVEHMGTAGAAYDTGRRMQDHERYELALTLFGRAAELEPGMDNLEYAIGKTYFEIEEYERAMPHLIAEWARDEDDEVPIVAGKALIRLGRFDEALEWLQSAQDAGEEPERVAYYRGLAYESKKDLTRAIEYYEAALAVEPDSKRARRALARLGSG